VSPRSSEPGATPLVFAHRGSSQAHPEHTLGAYLRAIDEGADGLECDVRLTRDGQLVCVHDRRMDRTSNGTGLISSFSLTELAEFDFASWHPNWPEAGEDPVVARGLAEGDVLTRILTPQRLLAAAEGAGRPLRMLIETKHPSKFRGDVEEKLVELLSAHGLERHRDSSSLHVTVMSFSMLAVRRLRELVPGLDAVWLTEFATPGLRSGQLPAGANIAGPGIRIIRANPGIVARLHARGYGVYVWTVNTAADVDLMLDLGVDGIITDRPRFVLDRLGR